MKTKKLKSTESKIRLILFLLVFLVNPWIFVFSRNLDYFFPLRISFVSLENQVFIDNVNTLRGELIQSQFPVMISRLLINKFVMCGFEITTRYLQTFDISYLAFWGDVDLLKSTHASGPLLLSVLFLAAVGIYFSINKNKNFRLLLLLIVSPIPASFISIQYESISRIPVFIMLSVLAYIGLCEILTRRKVVFWILALVLVFEFIRFTHDFSYHYPGRLVEQLQK